MKVLRNKGVISVRLIVLATAAAMAWLGLSAVAGPTSAKTPAPNGQIVFSRVIDARTGNTATYTVNPDGTHVEQLFSDPAGSGAPHWSSDGTLVSVFCCEDGMAAHIVDVASGSLRGLAPTDPDLEVHCGWWSSDGTRLACESFGLTDPNRTGIWTIRASDGGGPTQITSNPEGDDLPGDFSPDGRRLVFFRMDANGGATLDVVKLNGSGLRQITPSNMILLPELSGVSWSPSGNEILFVSRLDPDHRRVIFAVNADGSGLRQLPIAGCGGAIADPRSIGCGDPAWSPDGTKIVFTRVSANGAQSNIYTVNPDGSGLFQVTRGGLGASEPDWGPHTVSS
jgi:Tol biopolymer transport system component